MSSPAVLTWEQMPLEVAFRANTEHAEHFLQLSRESWSRLRARADLLARRGIHVPPPPIESLEVAESRMRALLTLETSPQALTYIHAYYRSIKHPWVERMDAAEEEAARAAAQRRDGQVAAAMAGVSLPEAEARRERALARLAGEVEVSAPAAVQAGDAQAGRALETDDAACVRLLEEWQILAAANDSLSTAKTETAALAPLAPKLRRARLELALLEEGARTHARLGREAAARQQARKRDQALDDLQAGTAALEPSLRRLPATLAVQYRERLGEIAADAAARADAVSLDEFEGVRRAVLEAAAAGEAAHAVVAVLETLGYRQVAALESLRAGDFQGVDLQIPGVSDRVVEVRWDARRGALSTEVVRTVDSTGSPAQQATDVVAQQKACTALNEVERTLAPKLALKIARRVEPGGKMKVRAAAGASARATAQRRAARPEG